MKDWTLWEKFSMITFLTLVAVFFTHSMFFNGI